MKKTFTLLAVIALFLVIANSAIAQKYYYYSKKEKKAMELITQSVLLLFKKKPTDIDLQLLKIKQTPEKIPQGYVDSLLQEK